MQLVESGKLDLPAPVSHYLEGLPAKWRAVTIGQIASHTSGLPQIESSPATFRLVVDGDADASWAKVQTLPMEFTPGEKFSYNQTNYVLLGKLIDVLGGEPFIQSMGNRRLVIDRPEHPAFLAVGAAKSAFAIYPDDDLAIVVLTNLSADMWLPFIDGIAAHYIPGLKFG